MVKFPTPENCSLSDPQEMFLPLLVALPFKEYRIALPVQYLKMVSERMYQLGAFMQCPKCGHKQVPKKAWRAPSSSTPHWLSDAGRWEYLDKTPQNRSAKKFAGVIPTREQCDLTDPREMFAWMFVGLPLMNGAPMLFDADWALEASEHLAHGGAMLKCPGCEHESAPDKEYVPPDLSGPHWLTSPGKWVPYGEKPAVSVNDEIDASLAKMSQRQVAELFKALEAAEAGRDIPGTPAGDVVSRMPDPQRVAILNRLRERDTA